MKKESIEIEDIKNAISTRTTLYQFLSRAFSEEVDGQFLEAIKAITPKLEDLTKKQDNAELKKGCEELKKFGEEIDKAEKDIKNILLELAAEYASLFLNVGPKPVYLVESVYLTEEHLLYGKNYFEILDAYRLLGFEKVKNYKEPEDHLAVELEFMSHLSNFTFKALEVSNYDYAKGYLNNQDEFLRDHLTKWVPQLSEKLIDVTTLSFYKAIAYLLNGFIKIDQQLVLFLAEEIKQLVK